jgi:hypothetical protein
MVRVIFSAVALLILSCSAVAHDIKGLAHHDQQSTTEQAVPDATSPGDRVSTLPSSAFAALQSSVSQSKSAISPNRLFGIIIRQLAWPTNSTLRVCFYDGAAAARAAVAAVAREWTHYGSVSFDFGVGPGYRTCQSGDNVSMRVSFNASGYWSLIGTQSIVHAKNNEVTMSLEKLDELDFASYEFKDTVLHEFGHALGFHHEHQQPFATCEPQFDKEAIKTMYDWSDADIVTNFASLKVSRVSNLGNNFFTGQNPQFGELDFTAYDNKSIMHYSLPSSVFKAPPGNCYIAQNHGLSDKDKAIMGLAYPNMKGSDVRANDNAMIRQLQGNLRDSSQIRSLDLFIK